MNRPIKSILSLATIVTLAGMSACVVSKKEEVVEHKPVERRPEIRHERTIEIERPAIEHDRIIEERR